MDTIRDEAEICYLGDVQRLALKPDDVIVISCEHHISNEVANRIKQAVAISLPGRKVLVISQMRIGVLSPEAADTASERGVKEAAHTAVRKALRSAP